MELEQQNHMLLLENLQYVNLKDRIQETKEALSLHLPPEYNLPPGSFLGHAGL